MENSGHPSSSDPAEVTLLTCKKEQVSVLLLIFKIV